MVLEQFIELGLLEKILKIKNKMEVFKSDFYFPKIVSKTPTNCKGKWEITEKVDGSQLSFVMMNDDNVQFFNRGRILNEPFDEVFRHAAAALSTRKKLFKKTYIYHGETIRRNRHNQITYGRVPTFYFVLFDIQRNDKSWLTYDELLEEGKRIGLEVVPLLAMGTEDNSKSAVVISNDLLKQIEDGTLHSMLGGDEKPEGIVIKHPHMWNEKKQKHTATKLKMVRDGFKEELTTKSAPIKDATPEEVLARIIGFFPPEPRWHKALYRLRDRGEPVDASSLVKEIKRDFIEECEETIMKCLKEEFFPKMIKAQTTGVHSWYLENKNEL